MLILGIGPNFLNFDLGGVRLSLDKAASFGTIGTR